MARPLYVIQKRAKARWTRTWWTSYPETLPEHNFSPVVGVSIEKACDCLKTAKAMVPDTEYRIVEAKPKP